MHQSYCYCTHEKLPAESESNRKLGVRLAWGLGRNSAASQGLRRSSATSPGLGRELSRVVWLLWDRGVHIIITGRMTGASGGSDHVKLVILS